MAISFSEGKVTAFGYTQQRTAVKRTLTATKLANHSSSNPPGKKLSLCVKQSREKIDNERRAMAKDSDSYWKCESL